MKNLKSFSLRRNSAAAPSAPRKVLTTFLAASPPGRVRGPNKTMKSFYWEFV